MSPQRRLWFTLATLALGLALAAVAATALELGYRWVRMHKLGLYASMWVADPDLVYKLNPDVPSTPGGFRGRAPTPERTTRFRIICLGASTTFGHNLKIDEAWPQVLEQRLRDKQLDVEVVNAGVLGYGSRQLLMRYRRDLAPLEADLVLFYEGWNRTGTLVDPHGWWPAGIARPGDRWSKRLAFALAEHSLILRSFLNRAALREQARSPPRPYLDPYHQIFVDDVRALVREMPAHGHRPALIVYPSLMHHGMSQEEIKRCAKMMFEHRPYHPEALQELERKHAALKSIAAETGCALLDLQEALNALGAEERASLFFDEMHLNVQGNARIADLLAEQIAPLLTQVPGR